MNELELQVRLEKDGDFNAYVHDKYGADIKIEVIHFDYANNLMMNHIVVPELYQGISLGEGIGTKIIRDLWAYADKINYTVTATAGDENGGELSKIRDWATYLGFVENKDEKLKWWGDLIRYPNTKVG